MNFLKEIVKRIIKAAVIMVTLSGLLITSFMLTVSFMQTLQKGAYVKEGDLPPLETKDALEQTGKEEHKAMIRFHTADESKDFFCSGTVISNVYALTADHCFREAGNYKAKVFDMEGNDTNTEVELVASLEEQDLALVTGDFKNFQKMMLDVSSYSLINKNGPFMACGFPYGENPICSPFAPMSNGMQFVVGTGFMYPGMSGGPVIDLSSGMVIGVNRALMQSGVMIAPVVGLFSRSGVKVVK